MKKTLTILATSIVIVSQTLPLTVKATTANNPNLSSVNADADFTYASGTYTDHFGYQTTTASYGPDIKLGKKIQARFSYNSTHASASYPITMTFKPTNGTFNLQDLASSLEIGTSYDITANSMDGAIQTSLSSEKYTVSTDASTNTLTVSIPVSTISEVGSDFIVLFTLTPNMGNYNGSDAFSNGLDTTYADGQSSQSGSWWTVVKVPQVTINAIDEYTNTTLSTNQASDLVDYQSQYTADAPDITNYTLDDSKGPTPSIGVNDSLSGDKVVNFYYTKDPVAGGDITAKYVDTDGNKISDDVVKSGNVGDTYSTDQKTIAGYTFKEVQGSATGTFTDQAQTVTYVYTKDSVAGGDITAKYVDTDGNKISDDVVKSGNVGDTYSTDQKTIAGYTFKGVQGSATGTFTDQAQTVTYVYTKNNVTPSPKPDDHSDTPESSKDNGNKNASTSENKSKLPQTGDNEELSMIAMISGILLILGTIVMILVKRKRQD